jgi:enoyl-[acyl-carrier protein] reductase I
MDSLINLEGKKGLVVGIANEQSIAYSCALQFQQLGAELAITYRNDKDAVLVRPLGQALACPIIDPLDVRDDAQMAALFEHIGQRWGRLDFLLHAVAFAPRADLAARYTDSSREGFLTAMDISCHSLVRLARHAEPLMQEHGGAILTLTYYGSQKYVEQYNVMGPVKAALEGSVRYLAAELGHKNIRVHALSPGPFKTRAASGIARFDELIDEVAAKTPSHQLADIGDVAASAAFLVSDRSRTMNGNILYIDAGYHIVG